ncbi:hypothetical protein LRS13_09210 [Svornostia abyssi]|uniref:Capsule polysaccharide biosynthesis protein n=1 Tax=Svornostia abyssi TaxID=2898438 RepID=A0ABY5PLV9_9ACTN|nr:hypothetical protein LRS13_09210 [Parviterribacteraceae bacterium J379]
MPTTLAAQPRAASAPTPARLLFVTLGYIETDFYARVGAELRRRGHEVAHLTASRRAARMLRRAGETAWCLADLVAETPVPADPDAAAEEARRRYGTATFREIYRTDIAAEGLSDEENVVRALRILDATERVIADWGPTGIVPEVGTETIRTAAHLVGLRRGVPVLFLFSTIFDDPLRLYVDEMHRHIVEPDEIVPPTDAQRARVEAFIAAFTARRTAIRAPRETGVSGHLARSFARHLAVKARWDRDNDWLRPWPWLRRMLAERARVVVARRLVAPPPATPYVYFPLHVVEDYKIKKLLPHCYDQGAIIELVAASLPHGMTLVAKEHPLAIGRTPVSLLHRISRLHNARVVPADVNSHDLMTGADAIVTIGSTVGLEALLYGKPVLTLGDPFYAGAGVTIDVTSFADVPRGVADVLAFTPDRERITAFLAAAMDRCLPGRPVLMDRSDENAATLAASLERGIADLAVAEATR